MKFSPTLTLALALAAGMAGAAVAQNSATSTSPQTQPQQNATQMQPQPSSGQAQMPNNANEQVRTAQQQLRTAGLYNGPVDGVMDPDTRAALARFQQQNGLQQTQSLDQQTLARLMSSQPGGAESSAPAAAPAAPSGS
jgi:peptidoglycan hydrolase-like protein with peptidoglycan-binding domain